MDEPFGIAYNLLLESDPAAAKKLSRVIVADLKREDSLANNKQIDGKVLNITAVSLAGCMEIEIQRKGVQRGVADEAACLLLDTIADELNAYMLSKRVEVMVETGGFEVRNFVKTTTTPFVVATTVTSTIAETTEPQIVASAEEAAMGAGTAALVAVLILVVVGIFVWGYYRYFAGSNGKESGKKVEQIELGATVESRTVSTKDSVSALPVVMNSVFETSFDNNQPSSTTDNEQEEFGAVAAIALSHRQSCFSLAGGAGEHANRKSIADWGFEADIDLDDMPEVVRLDGVQPDIDDSLPDTLPTGDDGGAPQKKKKGGGKAGKVKVSVPTPLGLSFKRTDDATFVVTKVKVGSNAEATGQVNEGATIVSVNGTALKGLEKADVVTLIKASGGAVVLELRGGGGDGKFVDTGPLSRERPGSFVNSVYNSMSPDAGAGLPSFDASQAEDAKNGATGDADHKEFRHSVLDAVLAGGDEVLAVQMGAASPKKKDKKAKKGKGKAGGLIVTVPSPLGFSFKQDAHGYLVTKVKEGGNAEATGQIKSEMRIISVNGAAVAGHDKPTVTNMIKSASAQDGKVTVEFAPPIAGGGGGGGGPPAATAMPQETASPKKSKDKKAKGTKKGANKKSSEAWNAMMCTKDEALERIRGKAPGSFVIRATDKAAAALSVIKPDGKMYNRLIDNSPGGLVLKGSSQTHKTLTDVAQYYTSPEKAMEGGLPCPLL